MLQYAAPVAMLIALTIARQTHAADKGQLISLQSACENFVCKLSQHRSPDLRDLKQQVTKAISDRGYSNAIVELNFFDAIRTATMNVNHDNFRINVSAKDGRLTSTNLNAN